MRRLDYIARDWSGWILGWLVLSAASVAFAIVAPFGMLAEYLGMRWGYWRRPAVPQRPLTRPPSFTYVKNPSGRVGWTIHAKSRHHLRAWCLQNNLPLGQMECDVKAYFAECERQGRRNGY